MASNSTRLCLRQSSTSKRLFSTSQPRRKLGPLTTFPPTSSPELDDILSTLRNNVFLPAHLSRAHKQLLYRPSLHPFLTGDEPVKVPLRIVEPSYPSSRKIAAHNLPGPPKKPGDFSPSINNKNVQSIQLYPIDRFKDEPRTKTTVNRILELMKTEQEFALLPDLFRELRVSKRKVTSAMAAKTVRKASDAGHFGLAVEMFRRHKSTGLQINDPEVAREIMRGAILRASRDEWSEVSVNKAIQNFHTARRLMDEPQHRKDRDTDVRQMPELRGAEMALFAIRAVRFQGGKDTDGSVKRAVAKLLEVKDQADMALNEESIADAGHKLGRWAPVWVGGKLAADVLGDSPERSSLVQLVADAEGLVQRAKGMVESLMPEDRPGGGLILYDALEKLL